MNGGTLSLNLNELLAIFVVQKSCESGYFIDPQQPHKTNDLDIFGEHDIIYCFAYECLDYKQKEQISWESY